VPGESIARHATDVVVGNRTALYLPDEAIELIDAGELTKGTARPYSPNPTRIVARCST